MTFHLYSPRIRGGFGISPLTTIATSWFDSFRLGDADGDGTPDLLVTGSTIDNTSGDSAEAWVQVHRIASRAGRAQVVEAREIFRDQYRTSGVLNAGINILGIGDATGDGVSDVTIEVLNRGFDDASLRAIVIQSPWSAQGQPPLPHTVLRAENPAGTFAQIGVIFRLADADGDGVLDLFRRDQTLELYRGL